MVAEPFWIVEELRPDHDRSGFSSGHSSLDDYIRLYASQNDRSGVSRTFVAVQPRLNRVLGYYALAAGAVAFESLTDEQRKRLPRYPVPVAHIGRLAVEASSQGRGLGAFLLVDAFARIERASASLGIHAIEVVAIDDRARSFYLKHGFTSLRDDARHLYISMKTVRKLGLT